MKCWILGAAILAIVAADIVFAGGLAVRQIGLANIVIVGMLEVAVIGFMAKPVAKGCVNWNQRRRSGAMLKPANIPALDGEIPD
jgi:hypothetical protein